MAQRRNDNDSAGGSAPGENVNSSVPTTNIHSNSASSGSVNVSNCTIDSVVCNATEDHRQYHKTKYDQSQHVHINQFLVGGGALPAGAYQVHSGSPGQYLMTNINGGGFGYLPQMAPPTGSTNNPPLQEFLRQYVPIQPPLQAEQNTNILPKSNGIEYFRDRPISAKARIYPGRQKLGPGIFRDVAIKVTTFTVRNQREVQNLVKLTPHANVVAFIHSDTFKTVEDCLYIVMEMCNPLTLEDYIIRRKKLKIPFNPVEAVEFSKQLIEGINHIHQNNIMHRDLKPSSVLFSVCGRFIKIIDFGMSKPLKNGLSVLSLSTLPIGTDGYRAPETYNKDKIKKESDIFSLAILLYHVWSYGHHAFDPKSLWSYNIKECKPPAFTNLLVPDGDCAVQLLQIMLVNDPEQRANITDVRNHPFNTRAVNGTLTKSADALWTGSIEASNVKTNLNDCVLYKEKHVVGAGIDSRWKLELNIVPGGIAVDTLQVPVEQTPHGYLGVKLACSKCLKEKLKEEQSMVWINIFDRQGKRTRALLIIRPPDYDELYGVLIRNPERLVSACESNLGSRQETVTNELVGATGDEQATGGPQETVEAESMAVMKKTNVHGSGSTEHDAQSEDAAMPEEMPEEMTPHQAEPRLNIPIGHLVLIPWWMHDPPSQ